MVAKGKPAKPGVDPRIKGRYMLAVTRRMERLAKPLGIKVKVGNVEELKVFIAKAIECQTRKRLEPHEMRSLMDACEVLRKIYQRTQVEEMIDELERKAETQGQAIADLRKAGAK